MKLANGDAIALMDCAPAAADFRAEFLAGLGMRPRRLPCKFFYDARGSALFDRICQLPEYYPTRTELGILTANIQALAKFCGPRCRLIELGSGSSVKTRRLLEALESPAGYVPIDISRSHLVQTAAALAAEYPQLEILPVCADYAEPLRLPDTQAPASRSVIFFPGSTIGNLEPREAEAFLRRIATGCRAGDRMLIGVDLEKPRDVLVAAYNDASGVTAAFNLNLLVRANRELGASFALEQFSHEAVYDAEQGRIEMHLRSAVEQRVAIADTAFTFAAGERIVTEYSYKYRPDRFIGVAHRAGWSIAECWSDPREWFAVFALERVR